MTQFILVTESTTKKLLNINSVQLFEPYGERTIVWMANISFVINESFAKIQECLQDKTLTP